MIQMCLLILTSLFVLSAESFWNLWVSLELYSFLLMPWLVEGEGKISKTHIFLYYLVQFMASISLLISSMAFFNKACLFVLFSSLLMKVSCFPFHSWFVGVLPYISWSKILVLTSLSKLLPLSILTMLSPPQGFIWLLMLGLIASLGGFSTPCLRTIVAYSSVGHSSWVVICACLSKSLTAVYVLTYFVMSLPLILFLSMECVTNMKAILASKTLCSTLVVLLLVLSGMPPFLGFIPKLMVIQHLTYSGAMAEAVCLGILSIMPIYFYFKTGLLSLGMKTYVEFVFKNSWKHMTIVLVSASVAMLLCFTLGFSLKQNTNLSS